LEEAEMSINSQTHIERKLLNREPNGNNPDRKLPHANDYLSRFEFLNPPVLTQAGLYEQTVKLPTPIKPWHQASKGATDRFKGCLAEIFPELKDISEKELKEIERKRHEL
jgi:hypothetical protein